MRAALVAVERELVRIDAQEDIQAKVQEELGERQREMLLREQMKQIRKELGEEGDRDDVEELRDRIAKLELTEVARERGRARAAPARPHVPAGGRVPGDPYLPGVDHRAAVERPDGRQDRPAPGRGDPRRGPLRPRRREGRVLEFLAVRKLQQDRLDEEAASDAADDPAADDEAAAASEVAAGSDAADDHPADAAESTSAEVRVGRNRLGRSRLRRNPLGRCRLRPRRRRPHPPRPPDQRRQGADPALRGTAGRGQDEHRALDCPFRGPQVRPHLARRSARRG